MHRGSHPLSLHLLALQLKPSLLGLEHCSVRSSHPSYKFKSKWRDCLARDRNLLGRGVLTTPPFVRPCSRSVYRQALACRTICTQKYWGTYKPTYHGLDGKLCKTLTLCRILDPVLRTFHTIITWTIAHEFPIVSKCECVFWTIEIVIFCFLVAWGWCFFLTRTDRRLIFLKKLKHAWLLPPPCIF